MAIVEASVPEDTIGRWAVLKFYKLLILIFQDNNLDLKSLLCAEYARFAVVIIE